MVHSCSEHTDWPMIVKCQAFSVWCVVVYGCWQCHTFAHVVAPTMVLWTTVQKTINEPGVIAEEASEQTLCRLHGRQCDELKVMEVMQFIREQIRLASTNLPIMASQSPEESI